MTAVFTPSKYQAAVFEWVKTGSGNAIINAVAGSGKSTTLVEAAKLIGSKTGLFLAFNKHIADELKTRLVGTSMVTSTIHSLSKATLEQHLGKRTDPNKGFAKWRELVKEQATIMAVEQDKQYQWSRALEKLIEKVMVTLTDARDEAALWGLVEHFGMEDVTPNMLKRIPVVLDKAEAITRATGQINFNEMIYWPCRWGLQPTKYDWVFVDEAQDLNAMQLEMALRARSDNGRIVFVGDESQAIYGFAGADAASFNTIRTRANAQELPLSVNYRCPKSHLALVRDIVPHIEDGPNAIDGLVHFKAEDEIYSLAQPRDYIVCRLNAPLVSTCIKFIQRRKSARVIGRDIGKDLCSLLDKVAEREMFDYAEIVKHLDEYERQQVIMLSQKEGNEQKIESLQDRIECLQVCAGEFGDCDNIDCLKREIEKLFGEEGDVFSGVSLSTVHKAKGLEADRIFVLKPEKLPLKWKNQSGWQYTQELNIRYISLTRAKKELFILGTLPPLTAPLAPPVVVEYEDTRNPLLLEVAGDNGAVQMMPIPNAAPVATAPLKSPILNALRSAKLEEEGCEDKQQPSSPVFNKAAVVEQAAPSAATFKVTGNLNADIKQIGTPRARLLALVDQLTLPEINTLIDLLNEAKKAKVEA